MKKSKKHIELPVWRNGAKVQQPSLPSVPTGKERMVGALWQVQKVK